MTKFHLTTLGCPKNSVDSDKISNSLMTQGVDESTDVEDADIVVVNTCAFIESARTESIDTVLALAEIKKSGAQLVVTGCMAQRYGDELAEALPEADLVVGFDGASKILQNLKSPNQELIQLTSKKSNPRPKGVKDLLDLPRPAPSEPWAYIKLAEGCNRSCAFCAIPTFRGKQQSRTIDSIVREARELVAGGVKELVLISQDIAWYGKDLDDKEVTLSKLIKELDQIGNEELPWLRILYLYPSEIKGELLDTLLNTKSVVPYFDLSLQHASKPLLKHMSRWGSGEQFAELISTIRASNPQASFRSSFITGFPGETEEDHKELLDFIQTTKLDWAGFFPYSKEEGTRAFKYEDQIPDEIIKERNQQLIDAQQTVNEELRQRHIGQTLDVLVTEIEDNELIGRSHHESPEVDGVVIIDDDSGQAKIGQVIKVEIDSVIGVDLVGHTI
jgi:ribosomal protein S12 methylthiotransferase